MMYPVAVSLDWNYMGIVEEPTGDCSGRCRVSQHFKRCARRRGRFSSPTLPWPPQPTGWHVGQQDEGATSTRRRLGCPRRVNGLARGSAESCRGRGGLHRRRSDLSHEEQRNPAHSGSSTSRPRAESDDRAHHGHCQGKRLAALMGALTDARLCGAAPSKKRLAEIERRIARDFEVHPVCKVLFQFWSVPFFRLFNVVGINASDAGGVNVWLRDFDRANYPNVKNLSLEGILAT